MKLFDCLDIASACGLITVNEARLEIERHATSLFVYDNINKELLELYREITDRDIPLDCTLYEALDIINKQDGSELKFDEYEEQ